MPDADRPDLHLIRTDAELASACDALAAPGVFGFDTEFIRERSYLPQLCLVQAATRDQTFLIDPFAVDLSPLWGLMTDRSIRKVLHAATQDVEMCYLASGKMPCNLFDVQVAAGMVGLPYPLAYGKLVQRVVKVTPAQGQTFTEWSQRPLTTKQLEYARDDVLHLVAIHDDLSDRLDALGRTEWLAEEMIGLEDESLFSVAGEHLYTRVHGWQQLRPAELAVLRELARWRESAAETEDKPPRSFLRDAVLTTLARRTPTTQGALEEARGFPRPMARQYGSNVLEAIQRGRAVAGTDRPEPSQTNGRDDDPVRKMMTDLATAIGQGLCVNEKLNHGLFAARNDYADFVRVLLEKGGDTHATHLGSGWRRLFGGGTLEDILTGRKGLRVDTTGRGSKLVFG